MPRYEITGPDGARYEVEAPDDAAVQEAVGQMFGGTQPAAGASEAPAMRDQGIDAQGRTLGQPGFDPVSAVNRAPDEIAQPGIANGSVPIAGDPSILPNRIAPSDTMAGEVANAIMFGVRDAGEAVTQIPDVLGTLVNNAPRVVAELGSAPARSILGAMGVSVPDAEVPTITGAIASLFGRDDPGATPVRNITDMAYEAQGGRIEPRNWVQRIAGRMGQEIGFAGVPAVAALRTAARAGVEGARQMNPLTRMFVEPAAVDPRRFARQEMSAAALAGAGSGGVAEATDDPYAQMGGAALGVGAGAVASGIGSTLKNIASAVRGNPDYASQIVREDVANTIMRNSNAMADRVNPDDLSAAVDNTDLVRAILGKAGVEEIVPGFKASTADRSGDLGLAALESSRAAGSPNARLFDVRKKANAGAVSAVVEQNAPVEQAGAFSSDLKAARQRELDRALKETIMAGTAADTRAGALTPRTTAAGRGDTLRNEILGARDDARGRTRAAYEAADIDGAPVSAESLTEAIDGATAGLTETERALLPEGLLARVRRLGVAEEPVEGVSPLPPPETTLAEATTLKSELGRRIAAALADPKAENGGRVAARAMGRVEAALDDFIAANVTPEQQAALDVARQTKTAEAEAFGRPGDPVADVIAERQGGQFKVAQENVGRKLTEHRRVMDTLLSRVDTPATRTALREEILANADLSSAKKVDSFLAEYGERVDRFPGLRDELTQVASARTAADTAADTQKTLERDIGAQGNGVVAKYLEYGDARAKDAMANVIAAKDPAAAINRLLDFVGNAPKAVEGARKAFWDQMEAKAKKGGMTNTDPDGGSTWAPTAWKKFLDDPAVKAVAERLYRDNPEHWKNLNEIADALRSVNMDRATTTAANPSGTARYQSGRGVSAAEFQAKYYEVARGRVNPLYMVTYLTSRLANRVVASQAKTAYEQLLDKALLNPEIAAALLKEQNPANLAAMRRSAKGWLGAEYARGVDALFGVEDEQDDEVTGAIMRNQQ